MSVIKVKNNGKWETIPIIGSTSGSGVGKVDFNSDGTGEIFNDYENNSALGAYSHVEGSNNVSYQTSSHAEGSNGIAFGQASHVEGLGTFYSYDINITSINAKDTTINYTLDDSFYFAPNRILKFSNNSRLYTVIDSSIVDGYIKLDTTTGITTGNTTVYIYEHYAKGPSSHVEGSHNITTAGYAHAEGYRNIVTGTGAHAEGGFNTASADYAHAEGYKTTASGEHAHSENFNTVANGAYSHAEGDGTAASGQASHAEGRKVTAKGFYSHAEGQCDLTVEAPFFSSTTELALSKSGTTIFYDTFPLKVGELFQYNNNIYTVESINHASKSVKISPDFTEFITSTDLGNPTYIQIEPVTQLAWSIGVASHHEGTNNCAYGKNSHVGGEGCQALGDNSFVHGKNLIARNSQIVFGRYNRYDKNDIFQIGNGTDGPYGRDNILSLTYNGVLTTRQLKSNRLVIPLSYSPGYVATTTIDDCGIKITDGIGRNSTGQNTIGLIITGSDGNTVSQGSSSVKYTTYAIIGSNNKLLGNRNVLAVGENNYFNTLCNNSVCIGVYNHVGLSQALAVGYNCTAYGNASVAFGGGGFESYGNDNAETVLSQYEQRYTTGEYPDGIHVANAKQSMVTGKNNLALGLQSMANGEGNVAKNRHEFVVGCFNDYLNDTNNLFVVGNGTSHTSRGNAFVVTRDGVQNSSDINLKDNITDLKPKGELRLVEFDWKNTGRHSYGFIAQEVEQIYPEMVSDNGQYKMLNYNEAICAKIAELQNRIVELEKLIQK